MTSFYDAIINLMVRCFLAEGGDFYNDDDDNNDNDEDNDNDDNHNKDKNDNDNLPF